MQYIKYITLFFTVLFLNINSANAASTDWKSGTSDGAKVRLLSSFYDKNGETKLIAGLHFKIAKGWKIYGKSADGIGLPPSVDFTGSQNYKNHQIIWPEAIAEEERIGDEVLKYTSYKDEVMLPITIDVGDHNQTTTLNIQVDYGLCKDICVPASHNFSLQLDSQIDDAALQAIQPFYPEIISDAIPNNADDDNNMTTLLSAILFALIGGAILNIMPCVLPVLSIKLMSVIHHTEANISRIRFAFFSTICGILICFIFFSGAAIIIKLTGNSLGWGLQFQNPFFLIFLILILIILSGNLLDMFNISFDQFITNFLNKKIVQEESKKNIFIPNFLSGILAVLLATPCSAPFLGSAISFALTQDVALILVIFLSIGIGFSTPYIAVLISPKLVYLLPKPGNWMFTLKKILALFLWITALWLTYTLSHNIGMIQALIAVSLAVLILLALQIRVTFLRLFVVIALTTMMFSLPVSLQKKSGNMINADIQENKLWIEFNEESLHALVNQGYVVVVDVTADWCLTCKLNKVRVLHNADVIKKLKEHHIFAMRADITKPNETVMNFVRKHDRFAIPFNAVYGPNAKNGLLTSEFLRKQELLDFIDQAQ